VTRDFFADPQLSICQSSFLIGVLVLTGLDSLTEYYDLLWTAP
jgi:hypothetical protein